MKWVDNIEREEKEFGSLKYGDCFEWDDRLWIKITNEFAFDVCNNTTKTFGLITDVIIRDAEITFF